LRREPAWWQHEDEHGAVNSYQTMVNLLRKEGLIVLRLSPGN